MFMPTSRGPVCRSRSSRKTARIRGAVEGTFRSPSSRRPFSSARSVDSSLMTFLPGQVLYKYDETPVVHVLADYEQPIKSPVGSPQFQYKKSLQHPSANKEQRMEVTVPMHVVSYHVLQHAPQSVHHSPYIPHSPHQMSRLASP